MIYGLNDQTADYVIAQIITLKPNPKVLLYLDNTCNSFGPGFLLIIAIIMFISEILIVYKSMDKNRISIMKIKPRRLRPQLSLLD